MQPIRRIPIINARTIGFTIAFAIVGTMLLLTGCGGGGGSSFPTPTLPAGAVVFTDGNAAEFATRAMEDSGFVGSSARQAQVTSSVKDVMDLAINQIRSTQEFTSIASGASQTFEIACFDVFFPGSSGNIIVTVNGNATSGTGTISFNDCSFDGIVTVDGVISFDGTSDSAGNFTANGGGSISITDTSVPSSITMVMYFSESGNDFDGSFTSSFSFSIDGLPGGGFLVKTIQPLTGIGLSVTGGEIMLFGGDGTRIRILITGPNTASVEIDVDGLGTFVPVTGSPITF